jgi:hypothetical protein
MAVLNISNQTDSSILNTTAYEQNEYYFKIALSGKGLLLPSEQSNISLRSYHSGQFRHAISMVNANYTLSPQWYLKPKLQIDYRDNLLESTTYWIANPVLKLEYRWRKRSKIHFTTSGKWKKSESETEATTTTTYILNLGYQTAF